MLHCNFIHLRNLSLAEYNFVYKIKETFYLSEIKKIKKTDQLIFYRLDNRIQQLNLIMIESHLPNILSNIVLCMIEQGSFSLSTKFIRQKYTDLTLINESDYYIKYKLKTFLYYLLYTNISSSDVFIDKIKYENVYYFKCEKKELECFYIYQQNELLDLVYLKSIFQIKLDKSSIKDGLAIINLSIRVE